MNKIVPFAVAIQLLVSFSLFGQDDNTRQVQQWLNQNTDLSESDYSELSITDQYTSSQNQIEHLYLAQSVNGIRVINSSIVAAFKNGELAYASHNIINDYKNKISGNQSIEFQSAYHSVLDSEITGLQVVDALEEDALGRKYIQLIGDDYTHESRVELVYFKTPEEGLRLAWSFDAQLPGKDHWYNYFVDAESGELIEKYDWVISCNQAHNHITTSCSEVHTSKQLDQSLTIFDGSAYRVFEFPIESPNHGERTLATEPADPMASPYGWHDINGEEGPEFTTTNGNNVFAYEDVNDFNFGDPAEGGEDLTFDFPYNRNLLPESYREAAITNLFYANNRIHDILYYYGFDEAAGNFQELNYSDEGQDGDGVNAEAQDGGGTDNANFATPPDGQNPRMQMYLWETGSENSNIFSVNAPENLEGPYEVGNYSSFGPLPDVDGITADLVIMEDESGENEGCDPALNPGELEGKIAVTYRGGCNFGDKVLNAQAAGALACLVINNENEVFQMGGIALDVEIPSLMLYEDDGAALVEAMENGVTVNATLLTNIGAEIIDGSFDNGVIIHEYGHGISNRLTNGPNNSFSLFNDEQMGEGWSDYYAILLTMSEGMENPVYRPMGTFANGEPTDGNGIRPVPYDTSFAVNSFTYSGVANAGAISQPHGIGFIWCSMLWDMTWLLIDQYGFDPDIINGEGGNNISMMLVTEAMKLQPSAPGFVDGRDAILAADELLYDGAHQCLIWRAFARRGLGVSADQGSSGNRFDGEEAFDVPTACLTATSPPVASFEANALFTCSGEVQFTDLSTDTPQSWLWDFGDGNSSTEQNPTHVYAAEGIYTVGLTVTNNVGESSQVFEDYIEYGLPDSPSANNEQGCTGDTITLQAITNDGTIEWRNASGEEIANGNELTVELGASNQNFFAYSVINDFDPVNVGPEDENFGNGGLFNAGFIGTVDFVASEEIILESAYVVSGSPGPRTIFLFDGFFNPDAGGAEIIQEVTVDIDFSGPGVIDLGFEIPGPGSYSIGLNQADLYRNVSGTNYPYEVEDLISIVGSSTGSDFYYYFYDIKVSKPRCDSEPTEVTAEVLGSAQFESEVNDLTVNFTDISSSAGPWEWDFGDGNTSTEQNPTYTYASQGTYPVSLTTESGCENTENIEVGTVGLEDIENTEVSILPNPANDRIRIIDNDATYDLGSVQIFDISGRLVQNEIIQNRETVLDVSNMNSGTYLITLGDKNGVPILRHRLIVAH